MGQDSILGHVQQIGDLASLAAQYGPFLFAILFILFVPVIGQRWFSTLINNRIRGNATERAAALQVYTFYWVSGIITGLVLTLVSVAWYLYVQMQYTLPDQSDKRLTAEISKRIYEGVIRGADNDDIFVYDNTRAVQRSSSATT